MVMDMAAAGNDLEVIDKDGDLILEVGVEHNASIKMSDCEEYDPEGVGTEENVGREDTPSDRTYVRLLVSSTFVTHASPVFKAMLDGRFAEGQLPPSKQNPPSITLPEDDPDATALFCRILHFGDNDSDKSNSADQLMNLATFSDKYDCGRCLHPWFQALLYRSTFPDTGLFDQDALGPLGINLAHVIVISYLLEDNDLFSHATETYCRETPPSKTRGYLVEAMDDLVPEHIADTVQSWQKVFIDRASRLGLDVLQYIVECVHCRREPRDPIRFGSVDGNGKAIGIAVCSRLAQIMGGLSGVLISSHMFPGCDNQKHGKEDTFDDMMTQWRNVADIDFDQEAISTSCPPDNLCDLCGFVPHISTELEDRIQELEFCLKGGICLPCCKQKGKFEKYVDLLKSGIGNEICWGCLKRKGKVATIRKCYDFVSHAKWRHCVLNAGKEEN
ncbi:hypothetical protein PV08_11464 [Exophiala spinifera]|uniref:BTB domain-containing protein n=1 Tax=Exophiala spinifera TaxID=91928 RepID=A0A0D2AVS1_9EURO|nr:uncharacterized protein PV08_11464 [Exophiala spinifera]KIW10500.1 hypothetical protein PV08_11464 [Exophiala spinifera]